MGAGVDHLATIRIEPPSDWAPLDRALDRLESYAYIVFTSRHAVQAVLPRLPSAGFPPGPAVVAVGSQTARILREWGVRRVLIPDEQSSDGVAAMLRSEGLSGRAVLYPTSDLAREDLRRALEAAGAAVDQIVAYRTAGPDNLDNEVVEALRRGAFDVVTLASPSAVRNLLALVGADGAWLRSTRLVCIGPTTAEAVRGQGLEPDRIATQPSAEGLVAAILTVYR